MTFREIAREKHAQRVAADALLREAAAKLKKLSDESHEEDYTTPLELREVLEETFGMRVYLEKNTKLDWCKALLFAIGSRDDPKCHFIVALTELTEEGNPIIQWTYPELEG